MNKAPSGYFIGLFVLLIATICLQSCLHNQGYHPALSPKNTYAGTLNVGADAGLEPVMKQEAEVFEFAYDSVKLNLTYYNEKELLDDFRSRKIAVAIMPRDLDSMEKQMLIKNDTIYLRELTVAYDAIAMVGNLKLDDSRLNLSLLKQYFSPANTSTTSPKMVFTDKNSSAISSVLKVLGYRGKISPNVYALNSVEEVIAYVEKSDNAIGFIPYSYLSDTDDERVKSLLKRIKILSLHPEKAGDRSVSANQSDIADGSYPLTRKVHAMTRLSNSDNLEWLFMNFLYQQRGAKIFLKAGLIPGRMPERTINVNTDQGAISN